MNEEARGGTIVARARGQQQYIPLPLPPRKIIRALSIMHTTMHRPDSCRLVAFRSLHDVVFKINSRSHTVLLNTEYMFPRHTKPISRYTVSPRYLRDS